MFRRGAAIVYDMLLGFAVFIVASALTLPFRGGKGATEYSPVLSVYFVVVFYLYLGWFWTHGGQTLGMRSWRIKLTRRNDQNIDWQTALIRYAVSLPMWFCWVYVILATGNYSNVPFLTGLPNWLLYVIAVCWTVIDHLPNNWRDRVSGTKIIYCAR